ELFFQLGNRGRGVFYYVVQDGRGDGLRIHAHVGERLGNRDRMGNECLAAQALLSLVGARAELVGLDDLFDVLAWQVGLEGLNQPAQPVVASNRRTGKFGENYRSVLQDGSYPVAGGRGPVAAT